MYNRYKKASPTWKGIIATAVVALFVLLYQPVIFALMIIMECLAGPPMGVKTDRENYAAAGFDGENIIIYQSDDMKFETSPKRVGSISVFNYEENGADGHWEIADLEFDELREAGLKDCVDTMYQQKIAARIVFGQTPECYRERVKTQGLRVGYAYYVSLSAVAKKAEKGRPDRVYLALVECGGKTDGECARDFAEGRSQKDYVVVGCRDDEARTCLLTNSPPPADIEERIRAMRAEK